ncbi:MAG: hypothetical protein JJD92_11375 [Frankiaceae bacterium]|nr:hypothetical protein [Frankiaceae bacterium]
MTTRRCLTVLAVLVALAGCGGSSGGATAPPASPSPTIDTGPAAQAAVTAAWEGFFKAGGSVDNHIALLEEGEKFRAELTKQASDPASKDLSVKVTGVVVSGTTAAVTYDLLGKGGAVLLAGSTGEAVYVGGAWVVSKKTYCGLVSLQDPNGAHPGCA